MLPARGEWNAALKRAAGERARRRKLRLANAAIVRGVADRKRVLEEILKKRK
jgi:hypothetical protein